MRGPSFAALRAAMVREQLVPRGITDPAVLAAMGSVPRERFVPLGVRDAAYGDGAIAIGRGQTISQPWIVAAMTQALELGGRGTVGAAPAVLDVGTGSGYQAAVLAAMGARVTTIDRDEVLAAHARDLLASLGLAVRSVIGDGSDGYPPDAPYDAIVVAAAAPAIPPPLLDQLAPGGRLVIPIGPAGMQDLTVAWVEDGQVATRSLGGCIFVPLVGHFGEWDDAAT